MSDEVVEQQASPAPDAGGERPRGPRSDRGPGGPPRGDRPDRGGDRGDRRKVCYFRAIKAEYVDYKDVNTLRRFVTEEGKILPRRVTGTTAKFQRMLTLAIKRARFMALIPYCKRHR